MLTYWVDVYVSISLPSFFLQPKQHSHSTIHTLPTLSLISSLSLLFPFHPHCMCLLLFLFSLHPPLLLPLTFPFPFSSHLLASPPPIQIRSRTTTTAVDLDLLPPHAADFSRFPPRHHRHDCQRRLRH